MAIYHFSAKIISRGAGRSAVAAAAYRAAERLQDERLGRSHDFSNKTGVVHSEVMLPEGAPERLADRGALWNEVEAAEKRKDAQLAREVEFAIPREMTKEQGIALARDFVQREFVDRGMIADVNVHWDIGADGEAKPHAHIMLSLRSIEGDGFGAKARDWNAAALLQHWRGAWADHVNERCAALGIDARIDHRSYAAQGVALEPQHKIGAAGARREAKGEDAERAADHRAIARSNGGAILVDPAIGLDALTRQQATFTQRDLAKFAHRHSDGPDQYEQVLSAMRHHSSVIALGRDGRSEERFTTRPMLSTEQRLVRDTDRLAAARKHGVSRGDAALALAAEAARGVRLSGEQRAAFDHVLRAPGLALVVGYAGTGKSTMLGAARGAWEGTGYQVRGAALSGIAAENLESGSGIASRTLASLEHGWAQGVGRLTPRDILVVDEAGMIGTRQMERVTAEVSRAGAKLVLVGDVQQLQAIEAGAAFRLLAERHGAAEIGEVRRQQATWMREATRAMARGEMHAALGDYARAGAVHGADSRDAARAALIDRWDAERRSDPAASRIILTHLKTEVNMLNDAARERLAEHGVLGESVAVRTERGERQFAAEDRILFLRNERSLGVKNGTLGTVERAGTDHLSVRLDSGARVDVDLKSYAHVDHGYAVTIHKAQGVTVDHSHILATPGLDAHASYVALSRHRAGTSLHYGRDDFESEAKLARVLGRERPKDMALDYSGDAPASGAPTPRAGERAAARTPDAPAPVQAQEDDRVASLRAAIAARREQARPTAESVRDAMAKAAKAIGIGRGNDRGAER
ncbi:MAG: Ti-type conjugative transfer relaxase TraA [Sphingopyxis sp.]